MQKHLSIVNHPLVSLSDRLYEYQDQGILPMPVFLKPFLGRLLLSVPLEDDLFQ
jgi:hypothetical protein